jgi:hypothetical protein
MSTFLGSPSTIQGCYSASKGPILDSGSHTKILSKKSINDFDSVPINSESGLEPGIRRFSWESMTSYAS